jgi:putative transposase
VTPGGMVYHVLNRSVGRMHLFRKDADFEAFERVMIEAHERHPIRILSYCVMSNHWHFAIWPKKDGELTDYFRWLAHTHAMRWRLSHRTVGYGHLYQGRFKGFPVQRDEHLLTLCRYIERNPVSAGLVRKAEQWHFSSLWARTQGDDAIKGLLSPWPVERPADWTVRVNTALSGKELDRIRASALRGRPYGGDTWVSRTVSQLHLEHTVRPEGRPKKTGEPPVQKRN